MRATVVTLLLSLSFTAIPVVRVVAQQPSAAQLPAEADPGVRPFRLIDRDEIRVSRVELQPGAVRSVHVHDDVEYHVWTPVVGTLEITIGNDAPTPTASGQAFFMKKGTPHGFRNTGTTTAVVFEIFVKNSSTTAAVIDDVNLKKLLADLGVTTGRQEYTW